MVTRDSKNILIADDSLFFRTKLSDILTEAGHKVHAVKDGHEVVEAIKAAKTVTDLLILDLQMPNIDGFGVLTWLQNKKISGKFPVLVITGAYEASEILEKLKSLSADGFMSKDLPPEQILFRVNRLIFAEKAARGVQRDRIAVNMPVDFTFADEEHTGVIISLSSTGAYIHTTVELYVGASISMKFCLPSAEKILNATGVVRWFPPDAASKQLFTGYGVNFTSINHDAQEEIKNFISEEVAAIELILHM
jgi:CheY-like chemotaxis protein